MTEAVWGTYQAAVNRKSGSFANFLVVNESIKKDFKKGFVWPVNSPVFHNLVSLRKADGRLDWYSILLGKLFSSEDELDGWIHGSTTFVTQGQKDSFWPESFEGIGLVSRDLA